MPSITIAETAKKPSADSTGVTPLTDPSKAYIAPDFYEQQSKPYTGDSQPRNPPHNEYTSDKLQKAQQLISSNYKFKQATDKVTANPNIVMTDKTTRDTMAQFQQNIDVIAPTGHSMWGTRFIYSAAISGGFAKQYISPNLNLGSTPNEDKTLFAPTMTLPQPCPVEVSTKYDYTAWNNNNFGREVRIFDFWQWKCGSGEGWTNVSFNFDNSVYVFDVGTSRPYYYLEIQYFEGQGWNVYFWNRNVNNWELKYNRP